MPNTWDGRELAHLSIVWVPDMFVVTRAGLQDVYDNSGVNPGEVIVTLADSCNVQVDPMFGIPGGYFTMGVLDPFPFDFRGKNVSAGQVLPASSLPFDSKGKAGIVIRGSHSKPDGTWELAKVGFSLIALKGPADGNTRFI